jgi:stearoyl-CoA desaturase (Delta-9 desaturase)
MFRYVVILHRTWLVNSAAHIYGNKPYDKTMSSKENTSVVYASMGEGYHNYHHSFPWDYSASEYGWKDNFNPATAFIEFFAWIGWAYDLRAPSREIIEKRIERTGDFKQRRGAPMNFWVDLLCGIIVMTWPVILLTVLRLILRGY